MRVGIDLLSERGAAGGIHTYVNELLRQLPVIRDEQGLDLEVVVFAHRDYPFLFDVEATDGLELYHTRLSGLPASGRRIVQHAVLPRLVRRYGVDLVHCVNNVLPARLACPTVVTVHDLSPFEIPARFGRVKHEYLSRAVPASIRRATRTICVSTATRDQVLKWVPGVDAEKLSVVPQAVSDHFSAERSVDCEDRLRSELGLPESFFLHVSRIEPGKNLAATSRALAHMKKRGLAAQLVVVGHATKHVRELRALWESLEITDNIHYVGEQPFEALPHLYRMARSFVFPSFYEGFGLPVLEAFACGTPTITSTRASLPEVAGRAALLVDPDDDEALSRAMERVWRHEELRGLLRQRGLHRATEFSWRETAERTVDVYRAALGHDSSPAEPPALAALP
jgi:glycosyltransferase involved in cell wall biosynthesis